MAAEAATLATFVVAGNMLLRPVVNAINRIPLASGGLEATYSVLITADPSDAPALRDLLVDHLELMRYPVAETEIVERSDETVEIRATLVSTAAVDADLDAIVAHVGKAHAVQHATWEVQTQDWRRRRCERVGEKRSLTFQSRLNLPDAKGFRSLGVKKPAVVSEGALCDAGTATIGCQIAWQLAITTSFQTKAPAVCGRAARVRLSPAYPLLGPNELSGSAQPKIRTNDEYREAALEVPEIYGYQTAWYLADCTVAGSMPQLSPRRAFPCRRRKRATR